MTLLPNNPIISAANDASCYFNFYLLKMNFSFFIIFALESSVLDF